MFREEIIDILNKSEPFRWACDTYYFLYKINPDESLVKVDYNDIKGVVSGIKEALSPYDIDEGELLLPYKIIVYELFDSYLAIKEYDCIYKADNINVFFQSKYVKINKYSFKELAAILKVRQKVTDVEFIRFVNWYSQVHRREYFTKYKTATYRNEYWFYIYASYVVSRCKISLPEKYVEDGFYMGMSLLKDTMNMLAKLKEKSEVSARSIDGLRRYHDEVLARYLELENKISKKKIKLTKEWKHIKDNLEKSSLNATVLDSEYLLAEEGKHMKNCVRSYYDFVKNGNSFIFHVDYRRKGYCCELKMGEGSPYIAQLLGACNSDDVPKNLVDKITKVIERKSNG